jgi:hypothetical protein
VKYFFLYITKLKFFMSKILRRDQFLKKNITNEAITNDIPWGDSLIGRLINSIARKAGIAIKAKRIDSVISGLRTEFDRLLEEGTADIDQSRIVKLQLWTFFSTLKKQVDDEEDVSIILNTAKRLRDEVDSISELEDKDNILEAIKYGEIRRSDFTRAYESFGFNSISSYQQLANQANSSNSNLGTKPCGSPIRKGEY